MQKFLHIQSNPSLTYIQSTICVLFYAYYGLYRFSFYDLYMAFCVHFPVSNRFRQREEPVGHRKDRPVKAVAHSLPLCLAWLAGRFARHSAPSRPELIQHTSETLNYSSLFHSPMISSSSSPYPNPQKGQLGSASSYSRQQLSHAIVIT